MARSDAYTRATGPRLATESGPGLVQNHTGGYVSEIGDLARARRFLVIGSTGGTYYQREHDITRENIDVLTRLTTADPAGLVEAIVDISMRGIAPKVDPQLFALAVCTASLTPARALAYDEFGAVIRTGSHLLQWARYHKALGGGVGRKWRRAVKEWYLRRDAEALAYQVAKYRQRDGRSQKDLIDMSHSLAGDVPPAHAAVLRWARGEKNLTASGELLLALDSDEATVGELIDAGASWEMLPDKALRDPETWEALIMARKLPLTAMIRQLARMTEVGLLDVWGNTEAQRRVLSTLTDKKALTGARIHPINVLVAARQYERGNTRSGLTYKPAGWVTSALNDAFDLSFQTAPASGKRHLIAVDISSSMTTPTQFGLTSHEIATVLALKLLRSEPAAHVVGFASQVRELGMTKRMTLSEALRTTQGSFGATNASAAIEYAERNKLKVDTFVVITDNEVNRGFRVPEALQAYRELSGVKDAKLIVLATTATNFTIADPNDPLMLDICGFGSDVPALVTEFSRGL